MWLGYLLSLVFNFHSNFVLSFGLPLPLIAIPFVWLGKELVLRNVNKTTVWLCLANGLFLLQSWLWLIFFSPAKKHTFLGFSRYWGGEEAVVRKLVSHLNIINSFYFPWVLVGIVLFCLVLFRKVKIVWSTPWVLILFGCITHVLVISFFLQLGQKYLLSLIPIFSLLLAGCIGYVLKRRPLIGLTLLIFVLFSNVFFVISERLLHPSYLLKPLNLRSYIGDYVGSLASPYKGSVEGWVDFFRSRNIEQAIVYADYEVDSLKFYLPGLVFINRSIVPGPLHANPQMPENHQEVTQFYLVRRFWGTLGRMTSCDRGVIQNNYTKHVLDFYDLEWNALPDITYHKFRLTDDLPKLVIYEQKSADFSNCR